MFGIIVVLIFTSVAGVVAMTLVSESFAQGVSRYAEAAMDAVEYRLARRAKRVAARAEGGAPLVGRLSSAGGA